MGKVRVRAESAKEYREKMKNAEALGLTLKEVWFGGAWETNEGEAVFLGGSTLDIEKVGRKYFHVPVSTPNGEEVVKAQPTRSSTRERGYVKLTFKDY